MNNRPDDANIMKNPRLWPIWPRLPIKNNRGRQPGQFPRMAVLIDLDLEKTDIRFLEGNMFAVDYSKLDEAPVANIDALVAEGWVVD